MTRIDHVAVLVPARNEAALLPRCLASLVEARERLLATGVSARILVVSDASTDGTYELARAALPEQDVVLAVNAGCVGVARARAAEIALAAHGGPPERCWLANTDADCVVPPDWLVRHLRHAEAGARAVAGIIDVVDFTGHDAIVEARFRATYPLHGDGTHPNVHGANLGVRADAYVRAGGWAPLASAEDHDLWRRLGAPHPELVSDARSVVVTSGRRVGRAERGFAEALAAHNP